jgi:hypothetical protein
MIIKATKKLIVFILGSYFEVTKEVFALSAASIEATASSLSAPCIHVRIHRRNFVVDNEYRMTIQRKLIPPLYVLPPVSRRCAFFLSRISRCITFKDPGSL